MHACVCVGVPCVCFCLFVAFVAFSFFSFVYFIRNMLSRLFGFEPFLICLRACQQGLASKSKGTSMVFESVSHLHSGKDLRMSLVDDHTTGKAPGQVRSPKSKPVGRG